MEAYYEGLIPDATLSPWQHALPPQLRAQVSQVPCPYEEKSRAIY